MSVEVYAPNGLNYDLTDYAFNSTGYNSSSYASSAPGSNGEHAAGSWFTFQAPFPFAAVGTWTVFVRTFVFADPKAAKNSSMVLKFDDFVVKPL